MEKLKKIQILNTFLAKVKHLRGYGDMDSYSLAQQFKDLPDLSENQIYEDNIDHIILDMASPKTWNTGKIKFIKNVETVLDHLINNQ